jgi:hypothetical protein
LVRQDVPVPGTVPVDLDYVNGRAERDLSSPLSQVHLLQYCMCRLRISVSGGALRKSFLNRKRYQGPTIAVTMTSLESRLLMSPNSSPGYRGSNINIASKQQHRSRITPNVPYCTWYQIWVRAHLMTSARDILIRGNESCQSDF